MLTHLSIFILIGTGLGQASSKRKIISKMEHLLEVISEGRGDLEGLVDSFTEDQMNEMDSILQLKLLSDKKNSESIDEKALKNLDILSHDHLFQAEVAPVTEEDLAVLTKMGLSKSDIEEVTELSKVMTSKEATEVTDIIKNMTDEELIKLSEIPTNELVSYVEGLKLMNNKLVEESNDKTKLNSNLSSSSNPKHFSRRDADPEPEPEPEPEPKPSATPPRYDYGLNGGLYWPHFNRFKRSLRLSLRTSFDLEKSSGVRYNDQQGRNQYGGTGYKDTDYYGERRYSSQGYSSRPRDSYYGDQSYGSSHEHRGRYGAGGEVNFGYGGGSNRRYRRSSEGLQSKDNGSNAFYSKVAEIVRTLKQERSANMDHKQRVFSAKGPASSPLRSRMRRHINMDSIMKLVGINRKTKQEDPELLYMSAVLKGQKHEVSTSEEISSISKMFEEKQKSIVKYPETKTFDNYKHQSNEAEEEPEEQNHDRRKSSTLSQDPENMYEEDKENSPAEYIPSDSYKRAMSRAKLVKLHPVKI
eukprot:GFUD01025033.1.p1 GENE.GFUD01025033.1~~GFUD01025033.1.p1  ORF type:complete len:527 (+),score=110.70 GFUD01025033.1:49-1629(+)